MLKLLSPLLALSVVLGAGISRASTPVSLNWVFPGIGHHIRCVAAIDDMNGDAMEDVLVEIDYTGAPDGHFKLLSGVDGSQVWGVSPIGGLSNGCGYGDLCVGVSPDLNGDGIKEALLGTSWGGRTAYAIRANALGTTLWGYDTYSDPPSGWVYSIDWIPDVNGDGVPDIVFGCGSDNNNAYCVSGANGSLIWKFAAPDAVYAVARIGDVNGNGTTDVLVATGDNSYYTYCIDGGSSGYATYIWRFNVGATSYDCAGIRDLNGDGVPDAVIGTWDASGNVICVSGATGTEIWRHPNGGDYIMRVVPTDDMNDDGFMEILVGSWKNAVTCLDGRTGAQYWSVPTGTTNGGDVWTVGKLGDVDYDGYADVIAGSFDLNAYCVSGRTGALLWTYNVGNRVYSVRGLSDVNGDGVGEAIVGTQYASGGGKVFCLDADGDATAVPTVEGVVCSLDDRAVRVSWTSDASGGAVGFNVYRAVIGPDVPAGEFRATLAEEGIDSAAEVLAVRAGLGSRGGFERLNGEPLVGSEYLDESVTDGIRYAYMVGAVTAGGDESLAGPFEIVAKLTGGAVWLAPVAPNPVRDGASIEFAVPAGERAHLSIYDPSGRLVRRLSAGTPEQARGCVYWDGLADDGAGVASGVYFLLLSTQKGAVSRKIVVIR